VSDDPVMTRDHRDLVITELADSALMDRVLVTNTERDAYRLLCSVALTMLHEQGRQLERERASRYRLIDEYRHLRAQIMRHPE